MEHRRRRKAGSGALGRSAHPTAGLGLRQRAPLCGLRVKPSRHQMKREFSQNRATPTHSHTARQLSHWITQLGFVLDHPSLSRKNPTSQAKTDSWSPYPALQSQS